jgi:multicomponent K+:H+ antiporter subunit E
MSSSFFRRWIPSRPLSIAVFVVWLLLVGNLAFGHIVLALVFALVLPLIGERLRPARARMQRPMIAARLAGTVLVDIVVSNIEVAKLILGPQQRIQPGWIWIPLDLSNDHGIAALAGIITMTPGTLSTDLSVDGDYLLVHCLNLRNAETTIAHIKQRYEAPLKEIFP